MSKSIGSHYSSQPVDRATRPKARLFRHMPAVLRAFDLDAITRTQ